MTKKSSSYTRTRTERMLRFMLRRQPCVLLAVTLFIAITAFTAMALAMIQMMRLTKDQARYIQDGINLMNSLRSRTNLWQCQYQLPPSNTTSFFLENCHATTGPDAVAVAFQQALTPHNCADIMYEVRCHNTFEEMRIKRKARKVRHIPKSCAGLYGAPMPYELVSSEHNVTAPRIRNELLKSLSGELVLASELMLRCPRCRVTTHYYSDDNDNNNTDQICRRQLETIRPGWPTSAEYCDEEELLVVDLEKQIYC